MHAALLAPAAALMQPVSISGACTSFSYPITNCASYDAATCASLVGAGNLPMGSVGYAVDAKKMLIPDPLGGTCGPALIQVSHYAHQIEASCQ